MSLTRPKFPLSSIRGSVIATPKRLQPGFFCLFAAYCLFLVLAGVGLMQTFVYLEKAFHSLFANAVSANTPPMVSVMEHAKLSVFDDSGSLIYALEAPFLNTTSSTQIGLRCYSPTLTVHTEHSGVGKIVASQAVINDVTSKGMVELQGAVNVEIKNPSRSGMNREILATSEMLIDLDKQVAETQEEVWYRRSKIVVEGKGASIDMKSGKVRVFRSTTLGGDV